MEITPFCVFLLYSPPLSFPVFSVLSSPLLTCPILSCTPFSFLFPCLSPFLFFNVLLPVYSPFLPFSCTLLLSSPLLPFSLAHSFTPAKVNKSGAVSTLSLLETAPPLPTKWPCHQIWLQDTGTTCLPTPETGNVLTFSRHESNWKKETSRLQNQGWSSLCPYSSVAHSQWKLLFLAIAAGSQMILFPTAPTAWGVPAVMGAWGKCEQHPSLPSAPDTAPETQCDDPCEQLQSQRLLSKAEQCLHFCGEKLSGWMGPISNQSNNQTFPSDGALLISSLSNFLDCMMLFNIYLFSLQ